MICGLLQNHLSAKEMDINTVREFKQEMNEQLCRLFPLSEADHLFVIASILDPGYKQLRTVPDNVRQAAYSNVRSC